MNKETVKKVVELQNNKALLSTAVNSDGMYYEYTKLRNRCFKLGGME